MTSLQDARDLGRSLRDAVSLSDQAVFTSTDRDPVAILEEQHHTRLQGLVPVRIGRMLESPFSYYRGTAAVMAHDLGDAPVSGHDAVICGDAHISNFGFFASPERRVIFDLNDFDEAGYGPWEWDVKRMAASSYIGALDNGFTPEQAADAARSSVTGYQAALRELCEVSALERYFFQVDTAWIEERAVEEDATRLRKTVKKATRRTSNRALEKIATIDEAGRARIIDQPPIMMHVDHATDDEMAAVVAQYRATLRADTALLLDQFTLHDWVLRVVGVGSVGTRCYVLLFKGPSGEPLFLQAKEAPPSVLATYGKRSGHLPVPTPEMAAGHEGFRVVSAQRILQAQSDPFLGWIAGFAGETPDRRSIDYYWRQFRDMKGSFDLERLTPSQFARYSSLCGGLLARAHSQSPGAAVIAEYIGESDDFADAVVAFSKAYADQTERDFAALENAVANGRLPVSSE